MIGNLEIFSSLDESVKSDVTLGNDNKVSIMGKGSVNIPRKKREKKYISDVYFVPGLKHNLMSMGKLIQKGYRVYFKHTQMHNFRQISNQSAHRKSPNDKQYKVSLKDKTIFEGRAFSRTPLNEAISV